MLWSTIDEDSDDDLRVQEEQWLLQKRPKESTTTVSDAIDAIGFGKMQIRLLLVCGLGQIAAASQQVSVSFLVHYFGSVLMLGTYTRGILAASSAFGMLLGGLFWGVFGDKYGRLKNFIISMNISFVFGILSAIPTTYEPMVVLRGLSAFGIGANLPLTYAWLSESLPTNKRGGFLNLLEVFWSVGAILCCAFSWLLLPNVGWKAFVIVTSIPSLAAGIAAMYAGVPESPHFLADSDRLEEAEQAITAYADLNNPDMDYRKLSFSKDNGKFVMLPEDEALVQIRNSNICCIKASTADAIRSLFPQATFVFIAFFTLSYGVGIFTWLPDILRHKGLDPIGIYPSLLMMYICQVPGGILTSVIIDSLGRRKTIAMNIFLAMFALSFFGLSMKFAVLVISMGIMQFFLAGAIGATNVYATEMFPYRIRSSALGFCNSLWRLGAVISPGIWAWLLSISVRLSICIGSFSFFISAILIYLSRKSKTNKKI